MSQTRKVNGITAHVDDWNGFIDDTVVVRLIQRDGSYLRLFAPNGEVELVKRAMGSEAPRKEGFEFRIPTEAIPALCAALLEQDPASERLTSTLEKVLDRESNRVDYLITKVSSPVIAGSGVELVES